VCNASAQADDEREVVAVGRLFYGSCRSLALCAEDHPIEMPWHRLIHNLPHDSNADAHDAGTALLSMPIS